MDSLTLIESAINKSIDNIRQYKDEAFKSRLKKFCIDLDIETESKRRFKRFIKEVKGNEETIYYNDGSVEGFRIITFVETQKPFDPETFSMLTEIKYY